MFSYFATVPKSIQSVRFNQCCVRPVYAGAKVPDRVELVAKQFAANGELLESFSKFGGYPLDWTFDNVRSDQDSYLWIQLLDSEKKGIYGLLDLIYLTGKAEFGVEYGSLSYRVNVPGKDIKAKIVKNNVVIGKGLSTSINVLNPNPSLTEANARPGALSWSVLNPQGESVKSDTISVGAGEMVVLDFDESLKANSDPVEFLTFTAKADFNVFPITFNRLNGDFTGCEHSQPPFQYLRRQPEQMRSVNILRYIPGFVKAEVIDRII